jgi:hypothetical protein
MDSIAETPNKPRKQRRIVELVRSDELWQSCRAQLVGKWVKDPEFCLQAIRHYLDSRNHNEPSCQIVFNYLTSSGFRSGVITRFGGLVQATSLIRKHVERLLVHEYQTKLLQMMPTHDHEACSGFGCPGCKFSGIIPGKI